MLIAGVIREKLYDYITIYEPKPDIMALNSRAKTALEYGTLDTTLMELYLRVSQINGAHLSGEVHNKALQQISVIQLLDAWPGWRVKLSF